MPKPDDLVMVTETPQVLAAMLNTAAVLEKAAERIRTRAAGRVPYDLNDLHLDYAGVARDVAHDVQACQANLNLDDLILACTRADRDARYLQERP